LSFSLLYSDVSVRVYHLVQRQCMEAWETECSLVMWGMRKMCSDHLRWQHLDLVLEFGVVEAAANEWVFTIWIFQCLLSRKFLKFLYDEVKI